MALDRFFRLPKERQQHIIETAAEAFAEHGYEGTSFNALLAKLGLSKSQAYYYFEDKADLFVTACAACYEQYYAEVERLPAPTCGEEFWEFVVQLCRVGLWFQRSHPIAARLTRAIAQSPLREPLGRASVRTARGTADSYASWIALGQRLGAVRSDLPADLLLDLAIDLSARLDVWFAERAAGATDAEIERYAILFADLSRRAFEASTRRSRADT